MKVVIGHGKDALLDTRPAELHDKATIALEGRAAPRAITWTYFYAKDDTYSRIDYVLLSAGMAREWQPDGTYVLALPSWGLASDHRPVLAAFVAQDR